MRFGCAGLLLLLAAPAFAQAPMRFWNLTGHEVTELSLAPAGSQTWGPNQCLNDPDHSVDNDERLLLKGVTPGRYDVRVGYKGHLCTVRNVDLKGTGKYAFSLDQKDLQDCR